MRRGAWTEGGLAVVEEEPVPLPTGWARLRVESCGICGSDLHLWHGHSPFKEVAIIGSFAYGTGRRDPEFRTGVDLLPRFRAEPAVMQTHRFGLDDVEDAFRAAADKSSGSVKVTVVPA